MPTVVKTSRRARAAPASDVDLNRAACVNAARMHCIRLVRGDSNGIVDQSRRLDPGIFHGLPVST
jgi:hypothetical protein